MTFLEKRRYNYVFKAPPKFKPVKREQIRGAWSVLQALDSVIKQINGFHRLSRLGASLEGGIILHGPKGTGKTLCSRYIATESNARFVDVRELLSHFAVDGHPVVELGAQEIRKLYKLGKEFVKKFNKPIIFFYDEFDEVDDHGVFEQMRIEIDGFQGKVNGVLWLLTSISGPDDIDDKLFRAGRIAIHVPLCGVSGSAGRVDILEYYVSLYPHQSDIDLGSIVCLLSQDDTPADIEQFVKDAFKEACLEQKGGNVRLGQKHLLKRCLRELTGFVVDESLDEKSKKIAAYHEAGHAVVARFLGLPVQAVTIMPTIRDDSESQGITISIIPDDHLITIKELENRVAVLFGGMVTEKYFGFPEGYGMYQDICSVNIGVQNLVENLLQGKKLRQRFGCLVLNRPKSEYSDTIKKIIEADVSRLIKRAERKAWNLIKRIGKARITRVAKALLEKKILLQNELDELIK